MALCEPEATCGCRSGGHRFFERFEVPDGRLFVVDHEAGSPFALVRTPIHAGRSARVVRLASGIALVQRHVNVAQVANAVVVLVAVNVVNVARRMRAVVQGPNYAMGEVLLVVD